MILKPFAAHLSRTLEKTDATLPLSEAGLAWFLSLVPEGETLPLVINDGLTYEEVLATNSAGHITLERGRGETEARKFPRGACARFEVTLSVVRHEICNYDCCPAGDCAEPPAVAGTLLPAGMAGTPWEGAVIFTGTLPLTLAATGLPPWCQAEAGPNFLKLSGTPDGAGSWNVSVAASGYGVVVAQGVIEVG